MSSKGKNFKLIEQALEKADASAFLAKFQDEDIRDNGVGYLLENPNQLASVIDTIGARNRFIHEWKKLSMDAPSHINQRKKFNVEGGGHRGVGNRGVYRGGDYRSGHGGGYRDRYRRDDHGKGGGGYRGRSRSRSRDRGRGDRDDNGGYGRHRDRGRNNEYGDRDNDNGGYGRKDDYDRYNDDKYGRYNDKYDRHDRRNRDNKSDIYDKYDKYDKYDMYDRRNRGNKSDKYDKYDIDDRSRRDDHGGDRDRYRNDGQDRHLDDKNRGGGGGINESLQPSTPIQNEIHNAYDTTNNGISMGINNTNNNINNTINNNTVTCLETLHLNQKTPNQKLLIRLRLIYRAGGYFKASDVFRYGVTGSIKNVLNDLCDRIKPQDRRSIIHGVLSEYNDKLNDLNEILDLDNVIFSEELSYLEANPQTVNFYQLLVLLIMTTYIGEKKQIFIRLKKYTMQTVKHIHEDDFEFLDEIYNNEGDLRQFLQLIDDAMVKICKWFGLQFSFNLRMQYIEYLRRLREEIEIKVSGSFYECYHCFMCQLCGDEVQKLKRNISRKQLDLLIFHEKEPNHAEKAIYTPFTDNSPPINENVDF